MILVHRTPYQGRADLYSQGWLVPKRKDDSFAGDTCESLAKLVNKYVWSPHIWDEGVRAESRWKACCWLVLDFDSGKTLWDALAEFADYRHVIGTTKSHQRLKNGVCCDRFRVALQLSETCTDLAQYKRSCAKVVASTGADKACIDGARIFFPCSSIESINDSGQPFTLPWAPAYTPPPATYPQSKKLAGMALRGMYTPGTRNKDVFYFACRFAERGAAIDEAIRLIQSKTDLASAEVERTVRQAYSHVSKGATGVSGNRNHNKK